MVTGRRRTPKSKKISRRSSNSKKRLRSIKRSSSSKKKSRLRSRGGGAKPTLSVNYPNTDDYSSKPTITLNKSGQYLITMTDPDAPAGTWTHYVAVINADGTVLATPYNYERPNPPSGTHRYIFNAYGTNTYGTNTYGTNTYGTNDMIKNNSGLAGNIYYTKILAPYLQNKTALTDPVEFKVSA